MPWRIVFFAANLGAAVLLMIVCVVSVGGSLVGGGSPFALIGGFFLFGPAAAFGVAEWCLYVRKMRHLEQPLGVACGSVGSFAIVAFVFNWVDAAVEGGAPGAMFWMIFGSICFVVATYGLWCCWLRVRIGTFPEERGFPVIGPAAPSAPPAPPPTAAADDRRE